jgi:hypothetical protein
LACSSGTPERFFGCIKTRPNGRSLYRIFYSQDILFTRFGLPYSHQFIEKFLVVVADAKDVLLILFGQGAAVLQQDAERAEWPRISIDDSGTCSS